MNQNNMDTDIYKAESSFDTSEDYEFTVPTHGYFIESFIVNGKVISQKKVYKKYKDIENNESK